MFGNLFKVFTNSLIFFILNSAIDFKIAHAEETDTGKGIRVSIEDARVQGTQLPYSNQYFVIDFNEITGTDSFTKTNNNTTYSYSGDLEVKPANQWGGGENSNFITQQELNTIRSYTIDISEEQKYFGFWWSAGDPYNQITFLNNGKIVAVFKTADLVDFIETSTQITYPGDYYGNPAYSGSEVGHQEEPFAYVNVFFDSESYDRIVVSSLSEGTSAFESDNHTFSAIKQTPRGYELPNIAPVAHDDTATTSIHNVVDIDVLSNDTDPDDNELFVESIDSVAGGSAIIKNNKSIVFTAGSEIGDFSLTYTTRDEYGATSTGRVTIKVTAPAD